MELDTHQPQGESQGAMLLGEVLKRKPFVHRMTLFPGIAWWLPGRNAHPCYPRVLLLLEVFAISPSPSLPTSPSPTHRPTHTHTHTEPTGGIPWSTQIMAFLLARLVQLVEKKDKEWRVGTTVMGVRLNSCRKQISLHSWNAVSWFPDIWVLHTFHLETRLDQL